MITEHAGTCSTLFRQRCYRVEARRILIVAVAHGASATRILEIAAVAVWKESFAA